MFVWSRINIALSYACPYVSLCRIYRTFFHLFGSMCAFWFGKLNSFFLSFLLACSSWSGHSSMYLNLQIPWCYAATAKKKCKTNSTLYFAKRNWKKMRTSITMNVFCTAASSKYWRMRIDLDFIWLLHTIFGKLLMQLSGNHVSRMI